MPEITDVRFSVYFSVTTIRSPAAPGRPSVVSKDSMYPCSRRIRASSFLSFDDGISTVSWAAMIPLRMRVRKSAMGSVMLIATNSTSSCRGCSPRARARAGTRGRGRTCGRRRAAGRTCGSACTPASCTWAAASGGRSWRSWPCGEFSLGSSGRDGLVVQGLEAGGAPVASEGHAQGVQQRERLGVGLRGGRDRHVHPAHLVDVVVVDLGEDDLLAH